MFLGIFTGIEVLFFLLGVMTTLVVGILTWLKMKYSADWQSLALLCTGLFTIIMAIAWSVSSVLEGEPQAGSMGMLVIFLPGLVISTFGARQVWRAQA